MQFELPCLEQGIENNTPYGKSECNEAPVTVVTGAAQEGADITP